MKIKLLDITTSYIVRTRLWRVQDDWVTDVYKELIQL